MQLLSDSKYTATFWYIKHLPLHFRLFSTSVSSFQMPDHKILIRGYIHYVCAQDRKKGLGFNSRQHLSMYILLRCFPMTTHTSVCLCRTCSNDALEFYIKFLKGKNIAWTEEPQKKTVSIQQMHNTDLNTNMLLVNEYLLKNRICRNQWVYRKKKVSNSAMGKDSVTDEYFQRNSVTAFS